MWVKCLIFSIASIVAAFVQNNCFYRQFFEAYGSRRIARVPSFSNATKVSDDDHKSLSRLGCTISDLSMTCCVPGDPIALARHRVARGHMFNPSIRAQEDFARSIDNYIPHSQMEGPIDASLIFFFARPKTHFHFRKSGVSLKSTAPIVHTTRKDLDNLIKFVLDALNGKAYHDDSQICSIRAAKMYAGGEQHARTVIVLSSFMTVQSSLCTDD